MNTSMITGFGKLHTNDFDPEKPDRPLKPYVPIDLAGIRALVDNPQQIDKSQAQWLICSTLHSRKKAEQMAHGEFHCLWADVDQGEGKGDEAVKFFVGDPRHKSIEEITYSLKADILGGADFELYTSASATPERHKCRILIPLANPLRGADWTIAQEVLNNKLKAARIMPDEANLSPNQVMYLPNRGAFYTSASVRLGTMLDPLSAWPEEIAACRRDLEAQEAMVAKRKADAVARRATLKFDGAPSPIKAFNETFVVEEILERAGYDRRGGKFRHPNSQTGNYSASVLDGRVNTFSTADPLYSNGEGAHDAFSAFCTLFHGGDRNAALRDAGDNWLLCDGGVSWNNAKQQKYMRRQELDRAHVDLSGFLNSLCEVAKVEAKTSHLDAAINLAPISRDELQQARLTPRCVLTELLYADVRTRISAGGTGKTTVALFEAITLALGRDLWGRTPKHPCKTVIVTREDSREILVARMREIMGAMSLAEADIDQVLAHVVIVDVSGESFRLSAVMEDVVVPHTDNLSRLVGSLKDWKPDWIIFDPLVSFGVGESCVNDAEQGLIEAFRILRNNLDCCVEGIHHSGKANARDKNTDQYAGRGGSALSDGCRMVVVMQPLEPDEWVSETGHHLADGETGIVMALPKLSFASKQEPIYIRRRGYHFARVSPMRRSPEQEAIAIENQVCQFITHEYSQGRKYSNKDLEDSTKKMNLSRAQIRAAITALKVSGRIIYIEVKGKSGSHFAPVTLAEADGDTQENELCNMDY